MAETRKVRTHGTAETRKVSTPIYSSLLPFRHPPVLTFRVFGETETRRAGGETERTQAPSNRGGRTVKARRCAMKRDGRAGDTGTATHERRASARHVHACEQAERTNMTFWVLGMAGPARGWNRPWSSLVIGFSKWFKGQSER
jgi:hypothetical protein